MKYYLAPMEAVNCASFRVLCMRRGADLVFTDMIDVDVFMDAVNEIGSEAAVKKYVNPQVDEKLAIQIGGRNEKNILDSIKILEKHTDHINFNIGCPLGYMLGKKGGVYLMKHPDQLYPLLKKMRAAIKKTFSLKIRSGWDSNNALEVAREAEEFIDMLIIHPRTKVQRYQRKANWGLVKQITNAIKVPVVLSGDVFNTHMANMAIQQTNCDIIMIARGAQHNPSIFLHLKDKHYPKTEVYDKKTSEVKKDFLEFVQLYEEREQRSSFSEVRDHALWFAKGCKGNKSITQEILATETVEELKAIFRVLEF